MSPASKKVTVHFRALLVELGGKRVEMVAHLAAAQSGPRESGESIANSDPVGLVVGLDAEVE
ncbi:hypothetical protein SAMN04487848_0415 [Microbacterium sp. ru370.1]|nr:hypothetical protein SAMN04487848_0415 [Microbacterium sp. ru370.1]SIT76884.1 hypothetical protein SAMN05880579_0410 [Microbacterium sp. RU1D]